MRWISRSLRDIGADFILAPEHWLAAETASNLAEGRRFGDIVHAVTQTQVPPENARFVLDTGNAREGLLDITILGNPISGRTSAKKVARDGDIIISRLRPYLRQVAYIPFGACASLGVEQIYCSTEFFVFRPREAGSNIAGLAGWLLSPPIREMVSAAATGGHHPRINAELLLNSPVEERFLSGEISERLSLLFSSHLQGQRQLTVLLGH